MARSIYRGPITFEDGSTAEDVEQFDDGTWINHSAARKQMMGQVIKAAGDRAQRKIEVPSSQSCTVLRVMPVKDVAGGIAIVSVDGDPVGETREVTISSTYTPVPGDRAQIAYYPPHGASIVAPISASGPPTASMTECCGGIDFTGSPGFMTVSYNVVEHEQGGMVSDTAGGTITVPLDGVYSVTANILLQGFSIATYLYYDLVVNGARIAVDKADPTGQQALFAGRAAVPLRAGDQVYAVISMDESVNLTIDWAHLDCALVTPYTGTIAQCAPCG